MIEEGWLYTPDFTGSCVPSSYWDEKARVKDVGDGMLVLLGSTAVKAVVTALHRRRYFSALAKNHNGAQGELEQGFPQPF